MSGKMDEAAILRAAERAGKPAERSGNFDLEKVVFDDRGLVPCIVQDYHTGRVLTLAYMNRRSLEITLERGVTCFWSRSRGELWLKGESSGNFQHIVTLEADCDYDAILVRVIKEGPACHQGTDSCFDGKMWENFKQTE
jgi:phosphoribosyl-AMP cyclohydrolase